MGTVIAFICNHCPFVHHINSKLVEVANKNQAECTPDFFVYNSDLELSYRGRFDETRPNMGHPTRTELSKALDALISGREISQEQYPSIECSIKWNNYLK